MTTEVHPTMPKYPRSAYINAPLRIKRRTSAGRRGWFAGWPDHCPGLSQRVRVEVTRPSDGRIFAVSVDKRLGELFGLFLAMIQQVGPELRGALESSSNGSKQGGVGSFFCRAIKGSNPPAPSNHSTGTAVDLWTRSNPQIWGDPARFQSTIHPLAVRLAAAADLFWGGWYYDESDHTYVDAMHFEYMRRPEDVADSIANLKAAYKLIVPPDKPEEPEVSATDAEVKELQAVWNTLGFEPVLVEDGDYGPITRGAFLSLPTKIAEREKDAAAATKQNALQAVEQIEPTV